MTVESPHQSRLSLVFGDGLVVGCGSTSRQPRDEFRSGCVQAPAGRGARGRDGLQGRVLKPAAVLGERASGTERAAGPGHLLRSSDLLRALAPGPVGSA